MIEATMVEYIGEMPYPIWKDFILPGTIHKIRPITVEDDQLWVDLDGSSYPFTFDFLISCWKVVEQ